MKNIKKKSILLFFFGLFLNTYIIRSQTNHEVSVLKWFDKNVSQKTLPISNGKLHLNFDRTFGTVHRYYNSKDLTKGSLGYDYQEYYDVPLKYDIFKDEIILTSDGESDLIELVLTKEKTQYFEINGRKFVNLNNENLLTVSSRGGYYEENLIGKNFTFYIKHFKRAVEVKKDTDIFVYYNYKNEFLLFIKEKYIIINAKSQLVKLFPNDKKKINDFYLSNRKLKKENEAKFMENLMRYINNI